jgi:hypothetical protein
LRFSKWEGNIISRWGNVFYYITVSIVINLHWIKCRCLAPKTRRMRLSATAKRLQQTEIRYASHSIASQSRHRRHFRTWPSGKEGRSSFRPSVVIRHIILEQGRGDRPWTLVRFLQMRPLRRVASCCGHANRVGASSTRKVQSLRLSRARHT